MQLALALSLAWAVTQAPVPAQHQVSGFRVPEDTQAFRNYRYWDHSKLPRFLQLAHCSGMALFARQAFNWARFEPGLPELGLPEYRERLREIYDVPTRAAPGARERVALPGFADWNELTRRPGLEEAVKDVLGDAIDDVLKPNWHWSPVDVLGSTRRSRRAIELELRRTVAEDRVATIYLLDGAKQAHSVLAFGYELLADRVRYEVYDSNHPDAPLEMDFMLGTARFEHPDLGARDPWILHPYEE